ncbi:unnamed protein product [Adineta steineri]|uniref:Ephrin RBD domain-containing protein n=1 Tax=Adineta steineri TaxID=433720 RepID=A0A818TM62_9BILA|nr:unnamed protein product [Adineta steineri]
MLRLIFIYFLLNQIHLSLCQSRQRHNYQIEWNSSNTFFQSKLSVLNVRLGDTVDFICPHYNHSSSMEYNTLYLVSEIDYNLCFTENYQPLFRCDQPYSSKPLIYTLSISKYLPYPNLPEFFDGHSYYFISTSNGQQTGINQKFDGLCRTKNFRLIVDVQKYYRRYSKIDNSQYRNKIQKQLSNPTNKKLISSNNTRLSSSMMFLLLSSLFLYLCS